MRRFLAIAGRGLLLLVLIGVAVLWRDSAYTLVSSDSVFKRIAGGRYPWSLLDAAVNLFALCILAVLTRGLWRRTLFYWRSKRRRRSVRDDPLLIADAPISQATEDRLSRSAFVKSIAELLWSSPVESSTVVGVEGPWGAGKTSALRLIKGELMKGRPDDAIVIEFDPWPEDTKRGVVSRLLDAIAHGVGRASTLPPGARAETERLLSSLADAVATDLGAGYGAALRSGLRWLDPLGIGASVDALGSLSADRGRLERTMRPLGRRLVVIVDDLDRVDEGELTAVLMAVSALSRLPNTNFLLAFDPEVVDSVLSTKGLAGERGSFREKIVHVSAPLPPPAFVDRIQLLRTSLEKVIAIRGVVDDWRCWDAELREEAETLCTRLAPSPRALKRLANHTGMLVTRLRKEVNGADVLLLELLRAHFPPLWAFIRDHRNDLDRHDQYSEGLAPSDFEESFDEVLRRHGSKDAEKPTPVRDLALATVPVIDRDSASQVFRFLFRDLYQEQADRERRDVQVRHSRVVVGRNLRKYFSMGVEGMDISEADVSSVLARSEARSAILQNALQTGSLPGLISSVTSHIAPSVSVAEPLHLVEAAMRIVNTAWLTQREYIADNVAEMLHRLLLTLPENERLGLLSKILRSHESIATSHELLLDLLESADLWRDGRLFVGSGPRSAQGWGPRVVTDDVLLQLKDEWLNTVWSRGVEAIFEAEPRPMRIMFRLGQLDGPKGNDHRRIQAALADFLSADKNLFKLVSEYSPSSTGQSNSVSGLETLIPWWSDFVQRVKSLGEPRDAIEKIEEYVPRPGRVDGKPEREESADA